MRLAQWQLVCRTSSQGSLCSYRCLLRRVIPVGGKEACGDQYASLERAFGFDLLLEDCLVADYCLLVVGSCDVVVPGRGIKTFLCDLSDICYRDRVRHLYV